MIVKVYCQICKEHIADVDTNTLSMPLKGSMFISKDPAHGFPPPFVPEAEWEDMECPWGPHRPFLEPNMVLTDIGVILIPQSGALEVPPPPEQVRTSTPPHLPEEPEQKPDAPPEPDVPPPPGADEEEGEPGIYPCQCFKCGNEFMSSKEHDEVCPRCKAGLPPIEDPEMPSIHELEKRHRMEEDGYVDTGKEEEGNETPEASPPEQKQPAEAGPFVCDHPGCGRSFKSQAALYAHSRVHKRKGE